ncbi:MAG: Fe-S cluster assembly protein SufD [Planctomycetota bacterium]
MTKLVPTPACTEALGRAAARARGEPAFLRELRAHAAELFSAEGFPGPRNENWRHTNAAPFAAFTGTDAPPEAADAARAILADLPAPAGAPRLVFLNGRFSGELSSVRQFSPETPVFSLARHGFHVGPLAEKLAPGAPHLGALAGALPDSLATLNTAVFPDGAFVIVPDGAILPEPIHLVFLAGGPAAAFAFSRTFIVIGRNARAAVVEHHRSLPGAPAFANAVTEIHAGAGSDVTHYTLQEYAPDALHAGTLHASVGAGARLVAFAVARGAKLSRNDLAVTLAGTDARVFLYGLTLADGRRHVDHHTLIDHAAPGGRSTELYKGVLEDGSRSVFHGRIVVRRGAQKTDARQTCRNLVLSAGARADARPELEILADDVKCSHGATAGNLDDNALFYLKSRGLDARAAAGLLIYGFAADILRNMENPAVRETLDDHLTKKFRGD